MPVSADIRRFLTEAFSDEEITTLCFDHFRPVYDTFASGMTRGQKIQILIEHCERHDEWPVLLSFLQRERPRQFAALLETAAPEITRSVPISDEGEPRSRSGGIDLNARDVSIGGDAVGRDKFITINNNVYIIHVGDATDPSSVRRAIDTEPPAASAHPHVENPFYTNGRINDPALFFDRERLIREIRSELSKRSSVSLVGESQVGKSSLLYYLYATRAEWLPDVAIEYIDLQRVFGEADFCKAVLKRIGVEGDSLQDLRDALETREVILLLDEVERIAEADFSPRLHDLLRSLTQEKNFALCVATQRPLEEVFPPRAPNGLSPFHNIFTHKTLGPFAEAEARRFLMQHFQAISVSFTEREISRLIAESRGHPAQLQRLAKELYDQLNGD